MVLLLSIISCVIIFFMRFYQYYTSLLMQSNSCFYLKYFVYVFIDLYNYSFYRVLIWIIIRLSRCHFCHKGGCDDVPIKIQDQSEY